MVFFLFINDFLPAVVKACEVLTEDGKIKEKLNGKQKCYFADQVGV
jgi:hypothetical protein